MGMNIGYLARNSNQEEINDKSSEVNTLKHGFKVLVISVSLLYLSKINIKSIKYLIDLVVNNHVMHSLFPDSKTNFHVYRENPIIPEDIIRLEILTRLSVKSLMRFQCVCKSWKYLISCDPVFIKSHYARSSIDNNDCLVVYKHPDDDAKLSDHPLLLPDIRLAGSVNGLVCLYQYHWNSYSIPYLGIWNPATHQYTNVPPPLSSTKVYLHELCFAFSFDPIENDYKVIYMTNIDAAGPLVANVYSCNVGSWGKINVSSSFILTGRRLPYRAISISEVVYLTCYRLGDKTVSVISFNTREELFTLFPSPDYLHGPDHLPKQCRLVNLRNSLAFIVHDLAETSRVDVFVLNQTMSSDCETWSKIYTIGPITLGRHMRILECSRDGDLIFSNEELFKYLCIDPETHVAGSSSMHLFYPRFNLPYWTYGFGYAESLVSVMGMKPVSTNECAHILFLELC